MDGVVDSPLAWLVIVELCTTQMELIEKSFHDSLCRVLSIKTSYKTTNDVGIWFVHSFCNSIVFFRCHHPNAMNDLTILFIIVRLFTYTKGPIRDRHQF